MAFIVWRLVDTDRGVPAIGRDTVTIYIWIGDE